MQIQILSIDEKWVVFYALQTDFWADERTLRAIMVTFAKQQKSQIVFGATNKNKINNN
jgi:hypothetical protein